jgi:hypothetical protein
MLIGSEGEAKQVLFARIYSPNLAKSLLLQNLIGPACNNKRIILTSALIIIYLN